MAKELLSLVIRGADIEAIALALSEALLVEPKISAALAIVQEKQKTGSVSSASATALAGLVLDSTHGEDPAITATRVRAVSACSR